MSLRRNREDAGDGEYANARGDRGGDGRGGCFGVGSLSVPSVVVFFFFADAPRDASNSAATHSRASSTDPTRKKYRRVSETDTITTASASFALAQTRTRATSDSP